MRPRFLVLLLTLAFAAPTAAHAGFPSHKPRPAATAGAARTVLPPPGFPPPPVYGFPTTVYPAGWYNTHYWPRKTYHHGFYGDYWQFGYFPGY